MTTQVEFVAMAMAGNARRGVTGVSIVPARPLWQLQGNRKVRCLCPTLCYLTTYGPHTSPNPDFALKLKCIGNTLLDVLGPDALGKPLRSHGILSTRCLQSYNKAIKQVLGGDPVSDLFPMDSLDMIAANIRAAKELVSITAMLTMQRALKTIQCRNQTTAIEVWRAACQKTTLVAMLEGTVTSALKAEVAKAKQGGAVGMLSLICRKMQIAGYARVVMNWKKARSCQIFESKIDGGGRAFLEDAKLKEIERAAAVDAQVIAERKREQREKEKRDSGLRMMRRIKIRMEVDALVTTVQAMIRNFVIDGKAYARC